MSSVKTSKLKLWAPTKLWWLNPEVRGRYWRASTLPAERVAYCATIVGLVTLGLISTRLAARAIPHPFTFDPLVALLVFATTVALLICDRTLSRSPKEWGIGFIVIPLLFGAVLLPSFIFASAVLAGVLLGNLINYTPLPRLFLHLLSCWCLVSLLSWFAHGQLATGNLLRAPSLLHLLALGFFATIWISLTQIWSLWLRRQRVIPHRRFLIFNTLLSGLASSGLAFTWLTLNFYQNQDAIYFLAPLAFIVWLSARKAQQYKEFTWAKSASQVIRAWDTNDNPDSLVRSCLRGWGQILECDEIRCYLRQPGHDRLVDEYTWVEGEKSYHTTNSRNDRRWQNFEHLTSNEGEAQVLGDKQVPQFLATEGYREILDLPMQQEDRFLGRLLFMRRHSERLPWTAADLPWWNTMQQLFSSAISASQTATKLGDLALRDQLTGLPNSTWFNQTLEADLNLPGNSGLLFFDLNNFKAINDDLGHDMGDSVLKKVAECLHQNVKATDTVARQHGDEFVLLIHDVTNAQQLTQVAARLLDCLQQPTSLPRPADRIYASVGGFTPLPAHLSVADVMRHASRTMYVAKRAGDGEPHIVDGSKLTAGSPARPRKAPNGSTQLVPNPETA